MTALEELVSQLDDDEKASMTNYIEQLAGVEKRLKEMQNEPTLDANGKINPTMRLYREFFTMYTRGMLFLQNHVHSVKRARKSDEFQQKKLDRMTGSGSELSPLERWLEGIGDDGDE